jgi:hypothetical protein
VGTAEDVDVLRWRVDGRDWGDVGVFALTAEVDLNRLQDALAAGRPTRPKIPPRAQRSPLGGEI